MFGVRDAVQESARRVLEYAAIAIQLGFRLKRGDRLAERMRREMAVKSRAASRIQAIFRMRRARRAAAREMAKVRREGIAGVAPWVTVN